MNSTTLVTFLLQAPLPTTSVNLLGSWDNFQKPYPMQKDSRTGRGHWRGCHTFQNIICDGDSLNTTGGRDGGLKMGGKYWYYYQLDDDVEYHNPAEPFTTFCPLLPGQEVNILEVPTESKLPEYHSRSRSSSSAASLVCTLNPEDRYLTPGVPPRPVLPRRATSTSALTGVCRGPKKFTANLAPLSSAKRPSTPRGLNIIPLSSQSNIEEEVPVDSTVCPAPKSKPALLWTAIHPFRAVRRSAITSHGSDQGRKSSPVSQRQLPHTSPSMFNTQEHWSSFSTPFENDSSVSNNIQDLVPSTSSLADAAGQTKPSLTGTTGPEAGLLQLGGAAASALPDLPAEDGTSSLLGGNARQPEEQLSNLADCVSLSHPPQDDFDIRASLSMALSQLQVSNTPTVHDTQDPELSTPIRQAATVAQHDFDSSVNIPTLPTATTHELHSDSAACKLYRSSSSAYTMNDVFSPTLSTASAYTGPMSPYHLSQPGTPFINDFGEDYLGPTYKDMWPDAEEGLLPFDSPHNRSSQSEHHDANLSQGGFQGYSLPAEEQASSLTLHKLPARASKTSGGGDASFEQKSGQHLVESWNDGAEHRMTAMEELFEDLGYLGGMIA